MENAKEIWKHTTERIIVYEDPEAKEIAFLLLEKLCSISKNDIICDKKIEVPFAILDTYITRINAHEPLQYVLEQAWFCDRHFGVSPHVLIPRPETEELVSLVARQKPSTVLDLGTGSGCIAISLALEMPAAQVFAIDISEKALEVAIRNAQNLKAQVNFSKADILDFKNPFKLAKYEAIVSNPPYIKKDEIPEIRDNVKQYEPHLALFVENHDPFLHYKKIAKIAQQYLEPDGSLTVEINSNLGDETAEIFKLAGFEKVKIIKDFFERDRFIVAK
jgi:release factor glutamine methyltransferase